MSTVSKGFVLLMSFACALTVQAQQRSNDDPWWFEVEAIIFEREVKESDLQESFPLQITPINTASLPSFITDALYPDFSMLRLGAKQCLANEQEIPFPKQTAKAPDFKTELPDTPKATNIASEFFANREFRERVLTHFNLSDPEFILTNSPSAQWQPQLENLFSDLNQSMADWHEEKPSIAGLALHKMLDIQLQENAPEIRLPKTLYCNWAEEQDYFETEYARELKTNVFLNSVPKVINGIEYPFSDEAYTLPSEQLTMGKLKRDIQRRRGLNVILHTAWRQNVIIGRDNAPWYRVYAGDNYSKRFDYRGLPIQPEQITDGESDFEPDIFTQIANILERSEHTAPEETHQPPEIYQEIAELEYGEEFEEVWTLDGRLKIFIEYIGGTPYLHIDSDLNYRKPIYIDWMAMVTNRDADVLALNETANDPNAIATVPAANFLQSYHFDQIRRVISNEIHYFDHPMFGMVFQIRRHRRPDPELPPDYYSN